jgi:phosphorylcholine metabolism protein LicD
MVSAVTLLIAAAELDDAGVEWWVMDGTCLSLVRSGGMESWQKDIDLGVWDIEEARSVLMKAGFPPTADIPNQFKSVGRLDVTGHRRDGSRVLVEYDEQIIYGFSGHLFDHFGTVAALGRMFPTPHPVAVYLTEHYGDWQTVEKRWDWKSSPPCVV